MPREPVLPLGEAVLPAFRPLLLQPAIWTLPLTPIFNQSQIDANMPISPSPLQMPPTSIQFLSDAPTLLSAAGLAHCRGPGPPLWMSLGRLPTAWRKAKNKNIDLHISPSSIFGSCWCLSHPGLHLGLLRVAPPRGHCSLPACSGPPHRPVSLASPGPF